MWWGWPPLPMDRQGVLNAAPQYGGSQEGPQNPEHHKTWCWAEQGTVQQAPPSRGPPNPFSPPDHLMVSKGEILLTSNCSSHLVHKFRTLRPRPFPSVKDVHHTGTIAGAGINLAAPGVGRNALLGGYGTALDCPQGLGFRAGGYSDMGEQPELESEYSTRQQNLKKGKGGASRGPLSV